VLVVENSCGMTTIGQCEPDRSRTAVKIDAALTVNLLRFHHMLSTPGQKVQVSITWHEFGLMIALWALRYQRATKCARNQSTPQQTGTLSSTES